MEEVDMLQGTRPMPADLLVSEGLAICEVCGNQYDKCFIVQMDGEAHVFDSFECAIHMLAPKCAHCGCQIIGHGMETESAMYCCAHCASQHGIYAFEDRVETERSSA